MEIVPQNRANDRTKTYLRENYFSHIQNLLGSPPFLRQIHDIGRRWTDQIPKTGHRPGAAPPTVRLGSAPCLVTDHDILSLQARFGPAFP